MDVNVCPCPVTGVVLVTRKQNVCVINIIYLTKETLTIKKYIIHI